MSQLFLENFEYAFEDIFFARFWRSCDRPGSILRSNWVTFGNLGAHFGITLDTLEPFVVRGGHQTSKRTILMFFGRVYKVVYKESPCKRGLNSVYKGVVINRLVDLFGRGFWLIPL